MHFKVVITLNSLTAYFEQVIFFNTEYQSKTDGVHDFVVSGWKYTYHYSHTVVGDADIIR